MKYLKYIFFSSAILIIVQACDYSGIFRTEITGSYDDNINENYNGKSVEKVRDTKAILGSNYNSEANIKKAISHLIDTMKIYQIYQYNDHNVVHVLDRKDQTKTGIIYLSKDLQDINYVPLVKANPYSVNYPIDTSYLGFPVYDVRGKTRQEIESNISNVIWDNEGEPTHIYTRSVSSEFSPVNMVRGYNLNIIGTEGPMAVQSKLYIEDKTGAYLDSIEHIGLEVWNPVITDDGRYVAYACGRSFPKEGGGGLTQHFTIYDLEKGEDIYEIKNFTTDSGRMSSIGNFICFASHNSKKDMLEFYFGSPIKQVFYKCNANLLNGATWGVFNEQGVLSKNDPEKLILKWEEDFEAISFDNYKQ